MLSGIDDPQMGEVQTLKGLVHRFGYFRGFAEFAPTAEGHGLGPWMNMRAFGRDVASQGRRTCHGLSPWGSTFNSVLADVIDETFH